MSKQSDFEDVIAKLAQIESEPVTGVCPACGGPIRRIRRALSNKKQASHTSCCWTPLQIIDNWDVYKALPPEWLQAIDKYVRKKYTALETDWKESEERAAKAHERTDEFLRKLNRKTMRKEFYD